MKVEDKKLVKVSGFMLCLLMVSVFLFTGCTTGNLISFSENTFFDRSEYTNIQELGPVQGSSFQTMVLYVFPYDLPTSTDDALQDALSQYESTVFLANMAVENHQKFCIGYSRICTLVTATAYTADKIEEKKGKR